MTDSAGFFAPLAAWFEAARRDLPWRAADLDAPHPDPYAVLVSELMLQQTQVATVVPYFARWMRRFPDLGSLAAADQDEVHRHWEGLGYYRRARHLHAAAKALQAGGWPEDLETLPGLGPYTAAAMASIAFQRPRAALDGNAFRVLGRLRAEPEPKSRAQEWRDWLEPALAALGPSRLTQALMELGATICLPKGPKCSACPLADRCRGLASGDPSAFPAARARTAVHECSLWLVAVEAEGGLLLEEPRHRGLLAGLWRWPALEEGPALDLAAEGSLPFGTFEVQRCAGWTQVYSHRRERVRPCRIRSPRQWAAGAGRRWMPLAEAAELPMGRRDRRLQELLHADPSAWEPDQEAPLAWILDRLREG